MFLKTWHFFRSHTEYLLALLWPCCHFFDSGSYSSLPAFPAGMKIASSLMRSDCGHPLTSNGLFLGKSPIFCQFLFSQPSPASEWWHLWGLLLISAFDPTSAITSSLRSWGCFPHMGQLVGGKSGKSMKNLWDVLGLRLVIITGKLTENISTCWSTTRQYINFYIFFPIRILLILQPF